jgi:type VI protein secretion system component Hcp
MKSVLAFAAGMILAAQAAPVFAQPLDGYMKIDGVKGEVTAQPHKKWMQITGISKLPAGCRGDEGGGSLTVRVARMPDSRQLPMLGGLDGAITRFDMVDASGEPLRMTLEEVYVTNTFSGSPHHPIQIGFTSAEGAPTDESDLMTLNFKRVSWERPECAKRAIAAR